LALVLGKILNQQLCSRDVTMILLHSQSISYFNIKRTIWLKGYQNGNHIEPSEQRLQEISIAKNVVAVLVTLKPDSKLNIKTLFSSNYCCGNWTDSEFPSTTFK